MAAAGCGHELSVVCQVAAEALHQPDMEDTAAIEGLWVWMK